MLRAKKDIKNLGLKYDKHTRESVFKERDIFYVYAISPYQRIEYKTLVEKINLKDDERIDDEKYWSDKEMYEQSKQGRFMRLKLIDNYDKDELHLVNLKNQGLPSAPQGPQRLHQELVDYIEEVTREISFEDVYQKVIAFNKDRGWESFQSADAFAKSISIEAAELLECFQWNQEYDLEHVCEELADVMIYSILMVEHLEVDINDIIIDKIKKNSKKYPLDEEIGKMKEKSLRS